MKTIHPRKLIAASACILSFAAVSSTLSVSAQSSPMQGGSMQPSPMQGGSTPSATPDGSTQPSQMSGGNQRSSLNAMDRQFIVKAAQSDMTEIQTSQLALKRSQNPQVRQFAQQMITHHTQSSNKLKPLAAQKGIALPTSIGAENQAMLTQLTKLSGTKFDQAYMSGQAKAHAKTQATYQNELKQGQDADVKTFANQGLPIVTAHLRMAQNMVAGR